MMEAVDGKAKLGMVKRMNILKKRLLVREKEQALHFQEGCALAKELNNRIVLADLTYAAEKSSDAALQCQKAMTGTL